MTNTADYANRLHDFMRANLPLDKAGRRELHELASFGHPNFCLQSACTYAQADKAAILIDEYGADPLTTYQLGSDRHRGKTVTMNLLDETLRSYFYRPDVDHSPAGQERLAATVELLLKRGVKADSNEDPLENPVRNAWLIACPDDALDEDSLFYDWIAAAFTQEEYFDGTTSRPYELIRQYQPEAVVVLEKLKAAPAGPAPEPGF